MPAIHRAGCLTGTLLLVVFGWLPTRCWAEEPRRTASQESADDAGDVTDLYLGVLDRLPAAGPDDTKPKCKPLGVKDAQQQQEDPAPPLPTLSPANRETQVAYELATETEDDPGDRNERLEGPVIYEGWDGMIVDESGMIVDGSGMIVDGSGMIVDGSGMIVDGSGMIVDESGMIVDESGVIVDESGMIQGASGMACGCGTCGEATLPYIGPLGYLLSPSDPCFSDFISPLTNPVYFEDPRSLSEVRAIFLNNAVPDEAGGGQVRLLAVQLRAALSECLSVIVTKDGFISSSHPAIADGWSDIAAGAKLNVLSNPCTGRLFSLGATYEFASGSPETLQGSGDGRVNMFATGAARLTGHCHWISTIGYRLPMDSLRDSQSWYWSNHLDYRASETLYLLAECNWYHWTQSGSGGIDGLEGLDLFNFGSTGVTGQDIASGALGAKLKPSRHLEIGVAWEVPLTDQRDILQDRLTIDCIWRY